MNNDNRTASGGAGWPVRSSARTISALRRSGGVQHPHLFEPLPTAFPIALATFGFATIELAGREFVRYRCAPEAGESMPNAENAPGLFCRCLDHGRVSQKLKREETGNPGRTTHRCPIPNLYCSREHLSQFLRHYEEDQKMSLKTVVKMSYQDFRNLVFMRLQDNCKENRHPKGSRRVASTEALQHLARQLGRQIPQVARNFTLRVQSSWFTIFRDGCKES